MTEKYNFHNLDRAYPPGGVRNYALVAIANELAELNDRLKTLGVDISTSIKDAIRKSVPQIRSFSVPDVVGDADNSPYASELINSWTKPKYLQGDEFIIIRLQVDPAPVTTYIGTVKSVLARVEVTFPEDERLPCFKNLEDAKNWFYKYNKPREGEIVTIL